MRTGYSSLRSLVLSEESSLLKWGWVMSGTVFLTNKAVYPNEWFNLLQLCDRTRRPWVRCCPPSCPSGSGWPRTRDGRWKSASKRWGASRFSFELLKLKNPSSHWHRCLNLRPQILYCQVFYPGSSCSTAVEHTPAEHNSWGCGFKSRRVLGFFLLFSILSVVRP